MFNLYYECMLFCILGSMWIRLQLLQIYICPTIICSRTAVELWVLVRVAMDTHAPITDGEGSFGHVFL